MRDETEDQKCPVEKCKRLLKWVHMYTMRELFPDPEEQDISTMGFEHDFDSPKIPHVMEYLRNLPVISRDGNGNPITEKALIFAQWPSVFPYVERELKFEGMPYRVITGSMTLVARRKILAEFNNDPKVGSSMTCYPLVIDGAIFNPMSFC